MATSKSASALFSKDSLIVDIRAVALLMFIVACSMDFIQLVFVAVGVVTYTVVQTLAVPSRFKSDGGCSQGQGISSAPVRAKCVASSPATSQARGRSSAAASKEAVSPKSEIVRQVSSQPVTAPVFDAVGWDAEVDELVAKILPTANSDRIVQELAGFVKQTLAPLLPEVEVLGFASGDLSSGTAFRVAVPEVDIVLRVCPHVLSARLRGRDPQCTPSCRISDMGKLQKSAIRICTDRLVATGHCKFRRSAFRGPEPKVTLLVPASSGIHGEAVPIDLSINSTSPFRNAALLTECARLEPRAKALALLVRRWAKDRGMCHAAKGHLSPYAWTLLAMYFLQVGDPGSPLLPPLRGGEVLEECKQTRARSAASDIVSKSIGTLFQEFVKFYCDTFDFRNEAVSVRKGTRSAPEVALPLHIVLHEDGVSTSVAPSIEDPFDRKRNLSGDTTAPALKRMKEEIVRASQLCARGASLSELLEPWVPAEHCSADVVGDMED